MNLLISCEILHHPALCIHLQAVAQREHCSAAVLQTAPLTTSTLLLLTRVCDQW